MNRTIHIEGYAKDIDLLERLGGNYGFPHEFEFAELTKQEIPGMFFRFYSSDGKVSLDDAVRSNVTSYFGTAESEGELTGYSEYTVEGFDVASLTLGGHKLDEIVREQGGNYLHILIDFVE